MTSLGILTLTAILLLAGADQLVQIQAECLTCQPTVVQLPKFEGSCCREQEMVCGKALPGKIKIWRHGDRTPLLPYVTDPYRPFWERWPKGEFTMTGMQQHYTQGVKLRERYCDMYGLVNKTFTREEISIISSSVPRCIQSAAANFAGFYAESSSTRPQSSSWPSGWTPVPIITRPDDVDHALEPGHKCPRVDELFAARSSNQQFVKYWADHAPTLLTITENSGETITDFSALGNFHDCIRVEKEYYNWTLPSWITEKFYGNVRDLTERTADFIFGNGDFGEDDQNEIIMLRGGALLKEMLLNFQPVYSPDNIKYFAYSAHDQTVSALLRTLGAKIKLLGHDNPQYAAVLVFELWNGSNGPYVKVVYSADANSEFRVITDLIDGCPMADSCPYDVFRARSRQFLPNNIYMQCDNIL